MIGKIRRSWPSEGKYEVIGKTLDGRRIGVVCRLTPRGKVRVIAGMNTDPKNKRRD